MTTTTLSPPPALSIDVRRIAPPQRHGLIFSSFDGLAPGAALELVNDHDPVPLRQQFEHTRSGQFSWTTVDAGPGLWRVHIVRAQAAADDAAPAPVASACCGGCACR